MGSRARRRPSNPGRGDEFPRAIEPEVRSGAAGVGEVDTPEGRAGQGALTTTAASRPWPEWAVWLVSALLLFHMSAVVFGAIGVPPSSLLERKIADKFTYYHQLIDQGYAYRYYAEPPPTPVITARLKFADGRPDMELRIPDRSLGGPRMRHQRQLALANNLQQDFLDARRDGGSGQVSQLGAAYARHLCAAYPGCQSVTLHAQQHLIPSPQHVQEERRATGGARFDLFDESLFTTPEWIGEFSCDGF